MTTTSIDARVRPLLICILAPLALLSACGDTAPTDPVADDPTVDVVRVTPDTVTLAPGEGHAFSAEAFDDAGVAMSGVPFVWTSRSEAVVTVSGGTATAIAPGTAWIVAEAEGVSDSARVTVREPVASVALTPDTATLYEGDTLRVAVSLRSASDAALDRPVTWSSLNEGIATVDTTGLVRAVTAGSTWVLATSEGITDSASITVREAVAGVSIDPRSATLEVDDTVHLSVTVTSEGGGTLTRPVDWASRAESVATVDSTGHVTAVGAGSTWVVATSEGVADSAEVTVREPVGSVVIEPAAVDLLTREIVRLSAAVFTEGGTVDTTRVVTWWSADAGVAEVAQDGSVTANEAGSTIVTATARGVADTITVTVETNPVAATSYENFSERGYVPVDIPLPPTDVWWGTYTEQAHTFGDFYGQGPGTQAMFTATLTYDPQGTAEDALQNPAVYRFWRLENGSYVEDNTIWSGIQPCIHPRRAIVADFNTDARPDVFVGCTGYDFGDFPGEPNQVFLSQPDGSYVLQEAAPDAGFWHGVSAGDIDGDGDADVVAVEGNERAVFLNDGTGVFTRDALDRLPGSAEHGFGGRIYFNVELIDIDEDGHLDLLMGGHEWHWSGDGTPGGEGNVQTVTGIWFNQGDGTFTDADRRVIPEVIDEGAPLDFAVTGTGPTRTVWVNRTGGNEFLNTDQERYYDSRVLQRYDVATGTAEVVHHEYPAHWVAYILPYTVNGQLYVGSSDLRTPMEYMVP